MNNYSFLSNSHPAYIESMYQQYLQSPELVDIGWRHFFAGFEYSDQVNGASTVSNVGGVLDLKEFNVLSIINGYRERGHLISTTNPIRPRIDRKPALELADYDLTETDLDKTFMAGQEIGLKNATLRDIILQLNKVYCKNIGFEYTHIENKAERTWLKDKIENRNPDDYGFSVNKKRRILEKLNDAVGLEEFLAKKYGPTKRFGLEGGESTIAGLDAIITAASGHEVEEVIIGMAHRGRLNVLANILGKTYENIFNEFEGNAMPDLSYGSGDVKYHMGYSSQVNTPINKSLYLKLLPNPSHLEAVDPVMLGFARAKADIVYSNNVDKILPIMIHGDASVAGQGIVYEVLQMSQLDGYYVGGCIHFVINNQIGFTTDFHDARSSNYCTRVGNALGTPVFHVNGDDPEAVIFVCELATEYRQKFNKDVFVDMVCYRKHGHNESDNPEVTQPSLYKLIKNHQNPREIYTEILSQRNEVDKKIAVELAKQFDDDLQARLASVKQNPLPYKYQEPELAWKNLRKKTTSEDYQNSPQTGISKKEIKKIVDHLNKIPADFTPTTVIDRLINKNYKDLLASNKIDWAIGELMAYGSILLENRDVRFTGEDVKRGTFSHRHAVFFDAITNKQYNRLNTIDNKQGLFRIYNSLLSEFGVMGFEYGYSLASPENLVIWEAQFGDFANGAQTIIDQFIAAGESKWQRMSGLVLLLPHGYEGQGPEHSSARLERFLQLCSENNLTVTNITTPANLFHALRRQLHRPFRKPLINMSPKSLLRHPLCVSDLSEFEEGKAFQEVIDDANVKATAVRKVLYCTGKIYYDLLKHQTETQNKEVAIVRLEQIYPFPSTQIEAIKKKYAKAKAHIWVQEESLNMGAWSYLKTFQTDFCQEVIGRDESASPATGYMKIHVQQQESIVSKALS